MKFTMYHKNLPTITFNLNENGYIDEVFSIENEKHIHPFLLHDGKISSKDNYYQLGDDLVRWMEERNIPASRINLASALSNLGVKTSDELARKSFYLSLTDQYWIAPTELELKWEDINFYQNDFSEDVGLALFGNLAKKGKLNLHSPDNNTQGRLIKKWIINGNERVLVKGGSGTEQLEPFNEVLASEIFSRLDMPHIDYQLYFENRKHFSVCKNFTDENTEMITAAELCEDILDWQTGFITYDEFQKRCDKYNLKFDEIELTKMFIVDYLIANEDRHLNNFGFLRDSNTLKWKGFAPIFDSGSSMFYDSMDFELNDIGLSNKMTNSKPFNENHLKQLSIFQTVEVLKTLKLDNLNDIGEFYKNLLNKNQRNISENKINKLSSVLDNRVKVLKEISYGIENPIIKQFENEVKQLDKNISLLDRISHVRESYSDDSIKKEVIDFFVYSGLDELMQKNEISSIKLLSSDELCNKYMEVLLESSKSLSLKESMKKAYETVIETSDKVTTSLNKHMFKSYFNNMGIKTGKDFEEYFQKEINKAKEQSLKIKPSKKRDVDIGYGY